MRTPPATPNARPTTHSLRNRRTRGPTVAIPADHADPARPDHVRDRPDALAELVAEHDEHQRQDDPLPELVDREGRDRADRARRPPQHAQRVAELGEHASHLVAEQLGRLGQREGRQVRRDPRRDPRRDHPAHARDHDRDRRRAHDLGELAADVDAQQVRERAADRDDRVRGQQVVGRGEAGHHGAGGRELEPVHRDHRERAEVEGRGAPDRADQDQREERRLQQGGEPEDRPARPPVDEHPDERSEQGEGERRDDPREEQVEQGAALPGGQHRGQERHLEEPVAPLAHEPDRQQPPEIGAAHGATDVRQGGVGHRGHPMHGCRALPSRPIPSS